MKHNKDLLPEQASGFAGDAVDTHPPHPERHYEKYEQLIRRARAIPPVPTAVVWPGEAHALAGALEAAAEGLLAPLLLGPEVQLRNLAEAAGLDLAGVTVIDVGDPAEAAARAVALACDGQVQALMKGSLHTDVLMHAAVTGERNLRRGRRLSHVFALDVPEHDDILFITDAAINIFPDLAAKRDIVQNAIDLFRASGFGEEPPRVAILSAVEIINPKIPGTTDAAILCKMAERGQITGGILDGPLAMDNAVDPEAARIKGIDSPVAGRAQILVVPDLEAGNMLAKNLIYLAGAVAAGIVVGAAVPIILTSRADRPRGRLASAALGALYAHHLARERERAQL